MKLLKLLFIALIGVVLLSTIDNIMAWLVMLVLIIVAKGD